jgi:hypothetical protein
MQQAGTDFATSAHYIGRWSADASGPSLSFYKSSNGTIEGHGALGSQGILGDVNFAGSDGAAAQIGARIRGIASSAWAAANVPTFVQFFTVASGGTTLAETLRLSASGSIQMPRIGTTANAANCFLDNGTTPANSVLRSTSSLRYKTDIEPMDAGQAERIVKGLQAIWYRSTAEADPAEWSWYGFGAEQVAALDPRLVTWTYAPEDWEEVVVDDTAECRPKEGATKVPDGVAYDRLTVPLTVIVGRLLEDIASLKAEIATLKAG